MLAKDVMTENPVIATELMSVAEALGLLYEIDVRHLPVVRGRELVGIISDRDLRGFTGSADDDAIEAVESARSSTVGNFMNTSPVKVDPETNVREVVELMLLHRVGAVPVADLDTGDLLGIVSYVDLLRVLQETLEPGGVKLVTSHETTDFDALASCVALQKLFPGSVIGLSGGFAPNVHQYLTLHSDRFRIQRCQDLDLSQVDLLMVTDVRRRSRLAHIEEVLERAAKDARSVRVLVWDHHPSAPDDLHADEEYVQPVGAVTTLLVEELRARGSEVDREEATLFSLGIHEDTGSLAYARSSSRDATALAWLMGQGAQAGLLQRFLRPPLDAMERELLVRLLEAVRDVPRFGASIGVAALETDDVPASLARVSTEAFRILPHDGLFCAYRLSNGKTHVIGRAQANAVPIGAILQELGGGGHAGAGSATVHDASLDEVVTRVHEGVERCCRNPQFVRDLMSSPVRTVTPDMPLSELAHSLQEWGHTGAPVVEDGKLVGVISRRDVERAQREGRGSLAVKSCMAHRVRTVGPDTPLSEALDQMTAHNIGRLPVLDGLRIVGILSREDVLGHLYQESPC